MFRDLLLEMSRRGIIPNYRSMLPQIYSAALCGFEQKSQSLIERTLNKYGKDKKLDCISTEIIGVTAGRNIKRLRKLLRVNVIEESFAPPPDYLKNNKTVSKSQYVLSLSQDTVFEIAWLLAKKSASADGQEFSALTEQLFNHTQRTSGYFKRLFREIERHIAHGYYYSATVLISETNKLKDMLHQQRKSCKLDFIKRGF